MKLELLMMRVFDQLLTVLAKKDGSDLYLSTGAPPCAKFHGALKPIEKTPMAPVENSFALVP